MRLSIAMAGLLVAGCAGMVPTTPERYNNVSSMDLCMRLATYPPNNIHRPAWIEQLRRRGENCSQYSAAMQGAAAAQANSDRQMNEAIRTIQNARQPQPSSSTHTYVIDGRTVVCTAMGGVTTCN